MYSLLIADRDPKERSGIQWLVSTYSLPFQTIDQGSFIDEVIQMIENQLPDVVILELDMIPKDAWTKVKEALSRYVQHVILMTTEATFDRAMQAIELQAKDLWLKPNSPAQIKKTLQRCLSSLEKRREITSDNLTSQTSLQPSYPLLFLDTDTPKESYQVMLIQTENRTPLQPMLSILEGYEFQHKPTFFPLSDLIVCVFMQPTVDLYQEALRLLRDWEENGHEPLAIVLHTNTGEKVSLQQQYLQAKRTLELTFYKGYRQIIPVENERRRVAIDPFLTSAEQREWVEMLNESNTDRIKSWMYKEFLNLADPYPEPGMLRTRLTSILAQIRRFMKTYYLGEQPIEDHYHRVFESILYSPVLYRIVQNMLLFIYSVLDEVKLHKELSRLDIVERGLMYVEKHFYDADLSLEKVAEYVDRNPSYFSHLLSTNRGVSFRQILNQIRVREAKRYLLETQWTIQQVAERSGFTNTNYFSRVFKQLTGVTPRQYRMSREGEA